MGGNSKGAGQIRLVKGVPGGDCDSCSAWLLENIDKTKGRRAKVGGIARDSFAILLDDCIRRLLDLALPEREKDTITKEWAGRMLARLHASLQVHQWKLSRENPAYHELKAKMKTRADILVPKSEISQMVQEELRTAESYQFKLRILRKSVEDQPDLQLVSVDTKAVQERLRSQFVWQHLAGGSGLLWTPGAIKAIQKKARKARPTFFYSDEIVTSGRCTLHDVAELSGIPKVYWSTMDLPRFCAASKDPWWKWLWSHILEDKQVLLPGRDPSKVQRQIHDHFLVLVDARENGTF